MKKLYAIAAAVAMLFAVDASAQLSSGIRYGVIGGFTSTNTHVKEFDFKNVSLFHVGATVKCNLGRGFAIQPALTYQMKGSDLRQTVSEEERLGLDEVWETMETKVGYLELPVQIQWGPDLLALRPYAFVEPFLGYAVNFKAMAETVDEARIETLKNNWKDISIQRLEYGMGFGGGLEVSHVQISAQWFMNFGGLTNEKGEVDASLIGQTIREHLKKRSFQGFKISLAVMF